MHTTIEELLEVVFSVWSAPRLRKESIVRCELIRLRSQLLQQLEASEFSSEASREFTAEVGGWQLEVSPAWELAAKGSTS
jgi:hypothetical protein